MEKYKKLIAAILKIIKDCKLTLNGVEHILNIKHVADDNYMLGYFFQTDISFGSLSSNSCRLCKHHGNNWHLLNRISANDNKYLRVESTNPNLPLELSYTVDTFHDIEEGLIAYANVVILNILVNIYGVNEPVLIHENHDTTLKEHLILHYPEVFKKNRTDFTVFSSKRFESYNKVIKNLLATSVNYKNIPYSCAKKQ
uniref:DUF4304 domain-containing protein n=1 Tax=Strongyloides venezuelensis TaxID=75913 RepID=A0A0K0FRZ9_STRVS